MHSLAFDASECDSYNYKIPYITTPTLTIYLTVLLILKTITYPIARESKLEVAKET